jgi:hypothetical protein
LHCVATYKPIRSHRREKNPELGEEGKKEIVETEQFE